MSGGVRMVVIMPRRIRIREFTDAQIELRMLIAFRGALIEYLVTHRAMRRSGGVGVAAKGAFHTP